LITALIGLALYLAQTTSVDASPNDGCAREERALAKRFSMSAVSMEPESALRGIFDRATESKRRCPQSEAIEYFRLRAAELGRGGPIVRPVAADRGELDAMTAEAGHRFPSSARIATIRARVLGTVDSAKQASILDPTYVPAKVALAAAMLEAGQIGDARDLLEQVKNLDSTSDGFSVLARARLKMGDVGGARKAAKMVLTGRSIDLIEPDARDPRPDLSAHETLGMISLSKKQYADAAKHLSIAAQTSTQAQSVLANPDPDLRRAIERARRGKKSE